MDFYKGLWISVLLLSSCSCLLPPETEGCTRELNREECVFEVYCRDIITDDVNYYVNNGNNPDYENIQLELQRDGFPYCSLVTGFYNRYNNYQRFFLLHMTYTQYVDPYNDFSSEDRIYEIPKARDIDILKLIYHLDLSKNNYVLTPPLKPMPELVSLDLSHNSLTVATLSNRYELTNLTKLDLSYNSMNTIEVGPMCYKNLRTLNLSHNYIVAIPDGIFDEFSQLLYLDLSNNFIDTLGVLTFEGLKRLNSLLISYNRLTEINGSFVRFQHLHTLDLSHNRLNHMKFSDYDSLHELKYLNVSDNSVLSIENLVFSKMYSLQLLKLDNNSLQDIGKISFPNNTQLEYVDFSKNNIKSLPTELFKEKNLLFFDVKGNNLEGSLYKGTFEGLNRIVKLDLSNQQLTSIKDYAFSGLEIINELLLNRNKLQSLSSNSFKNLKSLSILDLSDNSIVDLNFDTTDLINLRQFLLRNNMINQIQHEYFHRLLELDFLDLSNNKITKIDPNALEQLHRLINFDISGNPLNGTLKTNTFNGLILVPILDISCTNLSIIQNASFTGMAELKKLNISHNKINELQFNSFIGISGVETIDLSFNQLSELNINVTDLLKLKVLLLKHNFLKLVEGNVFMGFTSLSNLDLSHNNITIARVEAFENMRDLRYLDISYNVDMAFNTSVIRNSKYLDELNLSGLRCEIKFTSVDESLLSKLDISNSSLININALDLKKLSNLRNVVLSYNSFSKVEFGAFSEMKHVETIDLSYNKICSIQPGVFKDMTYLRDLSISHNFLTTISYGVFSHLYYLEILDLSYNNLKSLEGDRFYQLPSIRILYVDNNNIDFISTEEFGGTSLRELSIGDNPIPCGVIRNLIKENLSFTITAIKRHEKHKANIDGILCANEVSNKFVRNESVLHDNTKILTDIRDLLQKIVLKNITHDHHEINNDYSHYFDNITNEVLTLIKFYNNTFSSIIHPNSKTIEENISHTNEMIESIERSSSKMFKESTNSTNELLEKIIKSLNHINPVKLPVSNATDNLTKYEDLLRYVNNVKHELVDTIAAERKALINEVESKINMAKANILTTSTPKAIQEKLLSDNTKKAVTEDRPTLFTDICVAFVLLILVCFVLYKFYKSRMFVRTRRSYSTRELHNAAESPDL